MAQEEQISLNAATASFLSMKMMEYSLRGVANEMVRSLPDITHNKTQANSEITYTIGLCFSGLRKSFPGEGSDWAVREPLWEKLNGSGAVIVEYIKLGG